MKIALDKRLFEDLNFGREQMLNLDGRVVLLLESY
jgi:hypothetical protein